MSIWDTLQDIGNTSAEVSASVVPGGSGILDVIRNVAQSGADFINKIFPNANISLKSNGFSDNEERLGEKYMWHVLRIEIHDHNKVPADKIAEAKKVMPIIFNVPLYDYIHMQTLEVSVDEYLKNPHSAGVPRAAVERAVFLKKTHFPESKPYWDIDVIKQFPVTVNGLGGSADDYNKAMYGQTGTTPGAQTGFPVGGTGIGGGGGSVPTVKQDTSIWPAIVIAAAILLAGVFGMFYGNRNRKKPRY